jgi:hypothetical protein
LEGGAQTALTARGAEVDMDEARARVKAQSEGSAPGALAPPSRAGSPEITRRLSL